MGNPEVEPAGLGTEAIQDGSDLDLVSYERGKGDQIKEVIDQLLVAQKDILSAGDCQRIADIETRIDMVLQFRQEKLKEIFERNGGKMTIDEVWDMPHLRKWYGTSIPLFAEIGESGGRYIRKDGFRDFWVGSVEDAQKRGHLFKDFMDIEKQWGGDTMLGKMEPQAKQSLFEALGVLEPGQSLEDKVKERLGKLYWERKYQVNIPTKIEGVSVHIWHESADQNPGVGKEEFNADLVIEHKAA